MRRFTIIVTLSANLRDILEERESIRAPGAVPRTSIDQRRRGRSSSSPSVVAVDDGDFGIRRVRDVHFSFSSVARATPVPPPRTRMTRRIVLFERENTATRKLLLTRSRATIRVFAGSSISFYLVTLSLRRRVEVRVTGRDGMEGGGRVARGTRDSGEARREMLRKSFPEESCSPLTISKGEHPS